ncbi:S8 family peptidase [Nostoc sp. DedQUE07]|uniref:S8 family peptidase n=1 Tax=Nostoc sp. DedQUE07 TaxID=3075392 RepID=UPI002AD2FF81|nr:S8 family serine peptidase [Nostoc sp. DedQUE07]MDZ8130064.1 S8 family serine peptidase [Nostoc sp. DedQUE07]
MILEDDFYLTDEQLDGASSEVRNQWGAEIDDKLENLLEHQILAEDGGIESTKRQQVIVHYKPTKLFDDFLNEFEDLDNSYRKRGEEFEFQYLDEFESLVNESIESLLKELPTAETGEHLRLGNAVVANLTPAEIKQIASRSDVEQIEFDTPLKLELDLSAVSVGVVEARTQGLVGTGKGVIIAVLDGEVDINHPDLKGRVVHKKNYTQQEWGNPHPHGTHVAGIIAGNGSKYKGMAPGAEIWSYKIFPTPPGESTESRGADAIEDVVKDMQQEKRLRIANCSWGSFSQTLDGNSVVSETAERATKLGLVLVKSAGNEGTKRPGPGSLTIPADARGDVIVVGASSRDSTSVMPFSSRGPTSDERPKPDILAPGELIMSAKPGGGYTRLSGTSMASPHIAGIAALILERYPKLQPLQVKKILMQSAKKLDSSEFDENAQGVGLVDAVKALQLAGQPLAEAEKVTAIPSLKEWTLREQVNIAVRNTGDETMQAVKATLVGPDGINLIGLDGKKVTSAEQDFGTLRIGAEATRDFAIEVPSNFKSPQCKLTLNLNFTTPTGKKKTCSYKLTHQVPSLQR